MKTNLTQLKEIYSDSAAWPAFGPAETCPAPETLIRCVRSELPKRHRNKVFDHIAHCGSCAREAKLLLGISAEEDRFIQEINNLDLPHQAGRAERQGSWLRRFSRSPVAAAAIVLVTAAILSVAVLQRPGRVDSMRGGAPVVQLLAPVNSPAAKSGLRFTWQEIPGAGSYVVEVFDASLDLVWRREILSAHEAVPPADLIVKLTPGNEYYWMVTASLPSGNKVKSRLEEFRITE